MSDHDTQTFQSPLKMLQPYLWNTFLPHLFPFHCLRSDFKLLHVALCNLHIPVTSTTELWVFLCSLEMDIKVTYICLNKTKHLQFSFLRSTFSFDQLKRYLLVQDMHTYTAMHDPEEMPASLCTPQSISFLYLHRSIRYWTESTTSFHIRYQTLPALSYYWILLEIRD